MRTPLAMLLLLAACPQTSETDGEEELDCVAMCVYLCNSAPADAGLDAGSCAAECTEQASEPTDCGECWAASGSLQAWDDASLLLDCACLEAPGLPGCETVDIDPEGCDTTCDLFVGFLQ